MQVLDELDKFHEVISGFLVDIDLNMQYLICAFLSVDE